MMEFKITMKEMKDVVKKIEKSVMKKAALPILETVLVKKENNQLAFIVRDMEEELHIYKNILVTGNDSFCIALDNLKKIVKLKADVITIIYDAANKGLRIAGGGLYTDSYLSSLGVDASTALSVKKWADSINLTEESDAELATAYSIGNLYRLINSNQESITQSLNQSVVTLQGRCTSLEQRVSALEKKVN